jgi:hypothetical protein
MLLNNQLAVMLRSYPTYLYGWPFAPVSDLDPNVTGMPRALRVQLSSGSASLKTLHQPLPHLWKTYDAAEDTFYWKWFNKWQRKTYEYPTASYEMFLLIQRFEALPAATRAAWNEFWFYENGGLDHYIWANFYRVLKFGRAATIDNRPNFSCWLPDTKIISLTSFSLHSGSYDVVLSVNTGNPYPFYNPLDTACIVHSHHYIRNWDGDEFHPPFSSRRHWQRNNESVDPQYFMVDNSFNQPQSVSFHIHFSSGWAATFEVSLQCHTFLTTGEHGCSNWFFLTFFNTEA